MSAKLGEQVVVVVVVLVVPGTSFLLIPLPGPCRLPPLVCSLLCWPPTVWPQRLADQPGRPPQDGPSRPLRTELWAP